MSHQEQNFEQPEEELENAAESFKIPCLLKVLTTVISFGIIYFCIKYFSLYISDPDKYAAPSNLNISTMFIFSMIALCIVWIPWQKMGLKITKIGGIEFKDIVERQATEHTEELAYLQDRIEDLENQNRENDGISKLRETLEEPVLRETLLSFLNKYHKWAFSPSRISVWGAKQQGYSSLSTYTHPMIRNTLQKMVAENELETRISKKGNTLYRVPKP